MDDSIKKLNGSEDESNKNENNLKASRVIKVNNSDNRNLKRKNSDESRSGKRRSNNYDSNDEEDDTLRKVF